ncbi:MAG: hypothetical protein K2W82_10630 [Candidatus Obscuribacterales bacterium]|nr:hypothetical protein [Candidatus Obscuribacterales bacterium]
MKKSLLIVAVLALIPVLSPLVLDSQSTVYGQQPSTQDAVVLPANIGLEEYVTDLCERERLRKLEHELSTKLPPAEERFETSRLSMIAAEERLNKELYEASVKDGAPDFTKAQAAQLEYDKAASQCKVLYDEKNKLDADLSTVREELIHARTFVVKTEYDLRQNVAKYLKDSKEKNTGWSAAVSKTVRALENDFVQKTKAKAAGNPDLQKAIQDYEKALLEVERKEAVWDAEQAASRKIYDSDLWQRKSEFRKEAAATFAKPADSVSAAELQKLKETGRKIAEQDDAEAKARSRNDTAYHQWLPAQASYQEAFIRVLTSRN